MQKHDDVFDVVKRSGLVENKTFLVIFGGWKHRETGEKLEYFSKYLTCTLEDAIARFQAGDYAGLAACGGGQTHVHFEARYVKSGALVAVQLLYTGEPDFGMAPVPAVLLQGEAGKRVVELMSGWKGE